MSCLARLCFQTSIPLEIKNRCFRPLLITRVPEFDLRFVTDNSIISGEGHSIFKLHFVQQLTALLANISDIDFRFLEWLFDVSAMPHTFVFAFSSYEIVTCLLDLGHRSGHLGHITFPNSLDLPSS